MKKPNVAVIFGSRSAEHDVSIVTAIAAIIKPLELSGKYNVVPVYIAKDGKWYSDPKLKDISLYSSGKIVNFLAKEKPVAVQFDGGFTLVKPGLKNISTKIDIAFPATHGTHGEDGELMAVISMANIPYVGCDMSASVLAMDKVLAKLMAEAHSIPTPKFVYFAKDDFEHNSDEWLKKVRETLTYPMFVKPSHLGSSIGISRVTDSKGLQNAIELALHYDDKALVEEAVGNLIEVTLPIMGNHEPRPALLEQPLLHAEEFFDFETKYMQGGKKGKTGGAKGGKLGAQGYSKLPADIPSDLYQKAEDTGLRVFRALGCSGLARVDMLIDSKAKKVYFNEVNPLPGSLYAHNWQAAGISNVQLVTELIVLAQERYNEQQKLNTVFSTNFLQQF